MKQKKDKIVFIILKIMLCIILVTFIELISLTAIALIPQEKIKQHATESADILLENSVFFYINTNDYASGIDRYADSILLNIAYSYDNKQPCKSIMRSSYYYEETKNENCNLQTAILKNKEPNKDYIRYWHGSNIIVKPLLLITNINGIYTLNAIIIFLLFTMSFILLWRQTTPSSAMCLLAACIASSLWYVPFSLEYTWNIIIMFIGIIVTRYIYKTDSSTLYCFFAVLGNITAYFDFLSTETLTYTVPFICILLLKEKEQLNVKPFNFAFLSGCCWGIGYTSSWILKWTLASIILKTNAFHVALQQANTRISGEVTDISTIQQAIGSIIRNISCLFPFSFIKKNGFFAFVVTLCLLSIIYYLFKKKNTTSFCKLMLFIALLPYLRFVLISNHSYVHYFFTYRAQLASIFAIGLAVIHGIDTTLLQKEWRKICKFKKRA